METPGSLRYTKKRVTESKGPPAKVDLAGENFHRFAPGPAPGLERDRAQPVRGAPIGYLPLAAFGVYPGVILSVRSDGTVDIALHKLGGINQHIDLQLTKIEVVESREKARPGTCFLGRLP